MPPACFFFLVQNNARRLKTHRERKRNNVYYDEEEKSKNKEEQSRIKESWKGEENKTEGYTCIMFLVVLFLRAEVGRGCVGLNESLCCV